MRILLIDDSVAYHEAFALLLSDAKIPDCVLDHAYSAEDGARLIQAEMHDAYIVDYRLPGADGLSLVRNARAAGIVRPIIVLTGFGNPDIDRAAEEAGANDYLPKDDFSPMMLERAIRYATRAAAMVEQAQIAEARLRIAQEAAGIGTWDWDIRRNRIIWSERQRAIYGLDAAVGRDIVYDTWRLAIHPDDRDATQAAIAATLAKDVPYDALFRISRPDPTQPDAAPEIRWIAGKGEVRRDGAGAPVRMIGVNLDVTEQQNAIRALEESRDSIAMGLQSSEIRFRTYFDSASDCLFHVSLTADGEFVYENINPAGLASVGVTMELAYGRRPVDILGPSAGGEMTAALRKVIESGAPYRYEPIFDLPGGSVAYDAVYMPLRDQTGAVVGVLGSARNVTERRRMEADLHHAQKMEALGQLAGGVAHDFNNLLTGMLGCFELLGRQVSSDRGRRLVEQGCKAVERSTALTSRLLAFSRRQDLTTQAVDLNASLGEFSEMLTRTLGADVRIGLDLAPELWPAMTDRNQIELAILNLGINARDAMPLGGAVTIRTRNETVIDSTDKLTAGDYVTVVVEDNGSGMPPEILAQVLEPFFTTKASGKGTGLGLSMVMGTMKQLGGGLTITSQPSKGTCVTLYMPRAQSVAEAGAVSVEATGTVAPACILLLDDDRDTQAVVNAYAAEAGHSVIVAPSGRDALAMLDAGRLVDILVVDETIPGLTFDKFITAAHARRPGLPVLIVSAKGTDGSLGEFPVVAKPFRQEVFLAAIAGRLSNGRASVNVFPLRA